MTAPPGAESAPLPSPLARWWMVGILAFAGLISYTDRVILSALVDPIRGTLGISDSQVSLLQGAAFAIVYVLAGLPLGRLADRSQRIRLVIAGSTLWSVGTILCGLAPGFWTLFGARVLVGVGEAALAPAGISMISDAVPANQRGTAVGIFLTGMVAGGPTAIALGGVLLGAGQDGQFAALPLIGGLAPWRIVLTLVGSIGLLIPILCSSIREPARREQRGAGITSLRDVVAGFRQQGSLLWPMYLALALLSIGDYGVLSWTPTLLSRRYALPPAQVGLLFGAVSAVGGILGSIAGGVLSDLAERMGGTRARLTALAGAAGLAALGAVLLSGHSSTLALTGLGIWTFASALGGTGGLAALGIIVPNEMRGVSIALVAFCNTLLGLGFGPTMVALATEQIFRQPVAVGLAMTVTIVPAGVLAALMFLRSRGTVAKEHR